MDTVQIFPDKESLASAAAKEAVAILRQAIAKNDRATWVLAGGTTPEIAYREIADTYLDAVDWSKVTFLIGDERIGPLDSPDNNWHAIEQSFLKLLPQAPFVRPVTDQPTEQAADEYEQAIAGINRLDLVWLGMGEDGHTLSLFPGHPDFHPTERLVIPIHTSPKPPADRISLTLRALERADHTFILASGTGKAEAIKQALQADNPLPIARAAALTHATWLIDKAAGQLL